MHPAAAALAEAHYPDAVRLGRAFQFPNDPGLGVSVAGEAVCTAAQRWVELGRAPEGFAPWMNVYVRRRLIDEWRSRRGRSSVSLKRRRVESLDAPIGTSTLADVVAHTPADVGAIEVLVDAGRLDEPDRWIIAARYDGWLLREIGDRWGVTEGRACQLLAGVRRRMAE